jgi:hypothetical protein
MRVVPSQFLFMKTVIYYDFSKGIVLHQNGLP